MHISASKYQQLVTTFTYADWINGHHRTCVLFRLQQKPKLVFIVQNIFFNICQGQHKKCDENVCLLFSGGYTGVKFDSSLSQANTFNLQSGSENPIPGSLEEMQLKFSQMVRSRSIHAWDLTHKLVMGRARTQTRRKVFSLGFLLDFDSLLNKFCELGV